MFIPERVYIKPQSKGDPVTDEIIRRVHAFDPNIRVVQMRGKSITYPGRSAAERWRETKKTLIITRRTEPFLKTFASPGNIVERMGVIANLCWQCPYDCNFCYLQGVRPAHHMIYINLEKLETEISVEPFAYPAICSLWTIISFALRQELPKIPANFHNAADYVREEFVKEGVTSKGESVELLEEILRRRSSPLFRIMQGLEPSRPTTDRQQQREGRKRLSELGFRAKDLKVHRGILSRYYKENASIPLRIIGAEFTDLIALDHLCGHTKKLLDLASRYPQINISLRTKSSYVDELVKCDGHNRVSVAVNFNTPFVIERYETGTASLNDRLEAARKVQDANGFRLGIVIEPMIKYPGYEKDYVELAGRIMKKLNPDRIEEIAMSGVRYSGRLEARVRRNFPNTDLFEDSQGLLPPVKHDRRRYPLNERVRLYKMVADEFRRHTKAYIRIGAET